MSTATVPLRAEERQLNLVLALRGTQRGLSAVDIVTTVEGYDPEGGMSARRKFERDKNDLRDIGIPLVVTERGGQPVYRIDEDAYVLPDVVFSPAHLRAIDMAVEAWQEGSAPVLARHALMKLRAVSSELSPPQDGSAHAPADTRAWPISITLDAPDPLQILARAIDERSVVAFDYVSVSSSSTRTRTVEPHRLWLSHGQWYLDGVDRGVEQTRTFRLSRLTGHVELLGAPGAFDRPELPSAQCAWLALAPGRGLALRHQARLHSYAVHHTLPEAVENMAVPPDYDVIALEYDDVVECAGRLAGMGEGVLVLHPPSLRQAVMAHLVGASGIGEATEEECHGASAFT